MNDDPFADRTTATMEIGPRNPADRRTQTERINGTGPGRFGGAEDTGEPEIDHDAPRSPYRTTQVSIFNGAMLPAGSILDLQPHEVGAHHVAIEAEPPANGRRAKRH